MKHQILNLIQYVLSHCDDCYKNRNEAFTGIMMIYKLALYASPFQAKVASK